MDSTEDRGLRSGRWFLSYKTSTTLIDGRPVDMLHDFYIPALKLAVRYDRVAGYFRSSSLAAASMGFSSFVNRQGKMRLIVGADLDPEDVKAVLTGDRERLAARLNGELDGVDSWPEGVQNGVKLLAWMVARGYLEVRVAFRVHRETGEPLPFDAVEDGYVHEKWFILYDEFGNRLYGSGTLNESKTALLLNAENIDIHCDWWGETDRRRVEEAAQAFERLWGDEVPHMPVMTLPEAVRRRLIRIAEDTSSPVEVDGSQAGPIIEETPSALERLWFAVLRDAPKMPGGRFVGMETAPVEPWPHQAVVARRLVETWPYSYLLCDEVGLGKTIEAGLAFRSLYLSGLAKRILIAAPASLTRQWLRQMASKMLLSFGLAHTSPDIRHEYIFPGQESRASASIFEPDLVIVSTGLLARGERAKTLLMAEPFDVALVDEVHAVRRRNPAGGTEAHPDFSYLYEHVRDYVRERAGSLWLATATPMQIHPVEVCDLLALTNRVGAFQFDPTLVLQYYEILGKLVHKQEPEDEEWKFLRRSVQAVQMQDPLLWGFVEENVVDGRIRLAFDRWLEHGLIPKGIDRELMCRLLFSVSPLARVMFRHTRRLLEIYQDNGKLKQNLPRRRILPMPRIVFEPLEREIYDELEKYCQGLARHMSKNNDSQSRQMVSFLLSFLRLRFASSLYALRETLKRRLQKVEATLRQQLAPQAEEANNADLEEAVYESEDEDVLEAAEMFLKYRTKEDLEWEQERLKKMLDKMSDLSGPSSKMRELLKRLDQRRDPKTKRIRHTVVFTRFYDTLKDIVLRLRQADPSMLVGTYSGQGAAYYDPVARRMKQVDREEVKERFLRGEIDVLVCTDAAAEGLNLQTADMLVNFDMGWNPMKVEQRIGRIDRIGQQHEDIYVLNLCYADSAEEIVYGRLLSRLEQASLIVGTQQVSLLPVEPEDFRQLAEGTLTAEELYVRARERLEQKRRNAENMEIDPRDLYEIYMRMSGSSSGKPPVDLRAIWEALSGSQYLKGLGCVVSGEPDKPLMTLSGIEGVPNRAVLTVSRELYEEGMTGDGGGRVHFASYGDPYFDAVLRQFNRYGLPPCVMRVAVPIAGKDGLEMVGYAAVAEGPEGLRQVRFIGGWEDLKNIRLLEDDSLSEEEIRPIKERLGRIAENEFTPYRTASRIERDNLRAARAQELLNLFVSQSLLEARAGFKAEEALFWPLLKEIDALYKDSERILLNDLPADVFRPIAADLLFECNILPIGDRASIWVPRLLARSALETASRMADAMKVKKSELRASSVLARLKREAEAIRKRLQ